MRTRRASAASARNGSRSWLVRAHAVPRIIIRLVVIKRSEWYAMSRPAKCQASDLLMSRKLDEPEWARLLADVLHEPCGAGGSPTCCVRHVGDQPAPLNECENCMLIVCLCDSPSLA